MSLANEKLPVPAIGHPTPSLGEDACQGLNIAVIFTSVESTLAALKEAGNLANHLGARIMLVVPQVVPYPLPLDGPPVAGGVQRAPLSGDGERRPGEHARSNLSVPRPPDCAEIGLEARFHRGPRRLEEIVANQERNPGAATSPCRVRSDFQRNGVKSAYSIYFTLLLGPSSRFSVGRSSQRFARG